jgi:predicted Fe-Mo cluster-binding NifX family protein
MKIAVATADFAKVSGHAGRARKWLVYDTESGPESGRVPARVELTAEQVFHYHQDGQPHPLDGITVVLAHSAGDGFLARMTARGIDARLTAESDPVKAVADYLAETLSPPKPRPIGKLLCKTLDLFSKHK